MEHIENVANKILKLSKETQHKWVLDEDGEIDILAYEYEPYDSFLNHNGPKCSECSYCFCIWCVNEGTEEIRYECK